MTFRKKLIFTGRSCQPHHKIPSQRTILYLLSATAYSIYSHPHSMPAARLLHSQPEYAPCRGTRDTPNILYLSTCHAVGTRNIPNILYLSTSHAVGTRDIPNIRNLRTRHAVGTKDTPNIRKLRTRHAVGTRDTPDVGASDSIVK
jgi:hypothetical protein